MYWIELILLSSNIDIILFYVQYFLNFRCQDFILSKIQRLKSDKFVELSISSDFRVFFVVSDINQTDHGQSENHGPDIYRSTL